MKKNYKIREISSSYNITTRTLRYYEEVGLIKSIRNESNNYRSYDEQELVKLEQILILKKLNFSINEIKSVFSSPGTSFLLKLLEDKLDEIDTDIQLQQQLKTFVFQFMEEIRTYDFTKSDDVSTLYDKSINQDASLVDLNYLSELQQKIDRKVPDIMVVRIPSFKAITTGVHEWGDIFKPNGLMFKLWRYYDKFEPIIFDCLDFTEVHSDNTGAMICSIKATVKPGEISEFDMFEFPGGLYAMAVSIDDDYESITKVQNKVMSWLDNTNFEYDSSRKPLFNMPYLDEENHFQQEIEKGLGYRQMQRYLPIRLKNNQVDIF